MRALCSLPNSYYLGETQDYEVKKREKKKKRYQVQNTKPRVVLVVLPEKQAGRFVSIEAQIETPYVMGHLGNSNV